VEAFEALALGFLPTVDEATAAIVARKLAPIADTPRTIIDSLLRRGGEARDALLAEGTHAAQHASAAKPEDNLLSAFEAPAYDARAQDLPSRHGEQTDIALVRNHSAHIGSPQFLDLVDRARDRPQLAMALLDRPDLSVSDEAVLYLHADDARRAQIRTKLEESATLVGRGSSLARPDPKTVEALLASAQVLDILAFGRQLAHMLHLTPAPAWHFQSEPRRELLALALVAAGITPEDCIKIFLTLHPAISRSVTTVHQMAHIARTVTRRVALHLVQAILDVTIMEKREARYVPATDPSVAPERSRAARPTVRDIRTAVLAKRAG
jgi:hypothetical protein